MFERQPSPPIRSTVIEVAHAPKPKADAADDEIVRRLRADPDPHACAWSPPTARSASGRTRPARRSRAPTRSARGSRLAAGRLHRPHI